MEDFSIKIIVEDMERDEKRLRWIIQGITWLCFIGILISFNYSFQQKVLSKDQQIQMYKNRWETRDKAANYYKQQLDIERAKNGTKVSH